MDRCILHSDLNSFYASVECCKRPEISGFPVVVCGNPSLRHGIVIAKNPQAKACNIKTGDTINECRRKAKNLVGVHTDYDDYIARSKAVRSIYQRYSSRVENFGIHECWIDVTDIQGKDMGTSLGNEIREVIKKETGLTVAVGASYNKTFAKLGSDLAGRDSTFSISHRNYRYTVWHQPVQQLMFAGRATTKVLHKLNIYTIGDLAAYDKDVIKKQLGVNGATLIDKARGIDNEPVSPHDAKHIHKSISSGITMPVDLMSQSEVTHLIFCLVEDMTYRMRKYGYRGKKLHLSIKSPSLQTVSYSCNLPFYTCSTKHISNCASELFMEHSSMHPRVRAITIGLGDITTSGFQLDLLAYGAMKEEALEFTLDSINSRFPSGIFRASKLDLNPTSDYFGKHLGLHKVAFSSNVNNIE